jgi:anti-sigma factor RsiW
VADNSSAYDVHADLGGYLLEALAPGERVAFERHLETCERCRSELAELADLPGLLARTAPAWELPAALEARTLVAVERAAAGHAPQAQRRRPRLAMRLALVPLAAALLAVAVAVGSRLGGGQPGELGCRRR